MKRPSLSHSIDPTVARRLDVLERLIDDEYDGSPKVFEDRTGIKMAQVGQWFTGYRALRDKALRRIEEKTGKPYGWFDLLILDEAHRQSPNVSTEDISDRGFGEIMSMVGITATPLSDLETHSLPESHRSKNFRKDFLKWSKITTGGIVFGTSHQTEEPPAQIELTSNADYPAIRRVAIKAQAGVTGYAVEYMNDDGPPIVFRKDWYTAHNYQPEKMLALRVAGESMVPSLYEGDLIVANTAQVEPKDGIAFVVSYEGEVMVKRMVRDDGLWWLASDNADQRRYPRKKCNGDTQIIGEVVYRQTERI